VIYLPDTNTVSYFFKGMGNIAQRWLSMPPQSLALSSLVIYELRTGARKAGFGASRFQQLEAFIASHQVLPFGSTEADMAATLRVTLEAQGIPIGPIDTLIAATALSHQATLVTHNLREFQRVPGLLLEDWF
jgi:tRNA(fMet)-specific endonuclease VapC